jgi:hypothetical protein
MAFVLLLDLVQRLPLVGGFATKLVGKFEQSVGDAYLFCLDAPARGAMKQRISRDLKWLQQRCEQVVVVAHSQGAALCHDVLRSRTSTLRPDRPVDSFVTVGSGVRRLHNMRKLYIDQALLSLGWLGVLAALISTAGLLVAGLGLAGGGNVVAFSGAALVAVGLAVHAWVHGRISPEVERPLRDLALPDSSTTNWLDCYSTSDPVPNGPLRTDAYEPGRIDVESCVVHNYRSLAKDHSGYVDNTDQVLTWLARRFVSASRGRLGPDLTDDLVRQGWRLRRWRTMCRGIARNLLVATGVVAAGLLTMPVAAGAGWWRLGRRLGAAATDPGQPAAVLLSLRSWIGQRPLLGLQNLVMAVGPETFVGVAVALIVVVISAAWLGWRWGRWDAGDINRLFPSTRPLGPWRRMPTSAWIFWSMVTGLVLASGAVTASFGPFHGGWRATVWVAVFVSLVSTLVVLVLRARTYFRPGEEQEPEQTEEASVSASATTWP